MHRHTFALSALVLLGIRSLAGQSPDARFNSPLLTDQDRQVITHLQQSISTAEMEKILVAFNSLDRVSGSPDEAHAAEILVEALKRYEIPYQVHRFRAYLSWPEYAELRVEAPVKNTLRAVTFSFSTSTPPEGLEGDLVFIGDTGEFIGPLNQAYSGKDLRGKIVIAEGLISPQSAQLAEDHGAIGLIHVNPRDMLHQMIMTTVWGTPTPETSRYIPRIPGLSITHSDGKWLRELASKGPVRVRLVTKVSTAWRETPLVVAEVKPSEGTVEPGKFILLSAHLDSWFKGMSDTASTDANILEMARIL